MIRGIFKKSLVFGILLLFLGVGITSCISSGSNRLMTVSDVQQKTLGGFPPNEEWNKTFGLPYLDDAAYDVQQTNDGGFIIGGYARSFGVAFINPWLIKIDSEGNMEWNKTFDYYSLTNISGRIWSVQQTTDDGYILGCTFFKMITSKSKEDQTVLSTNNDLISSIVLIKTDSQGHEEWNRTYTDLNYSWCFSARQTIDGGYIATGGGNVSTEGSPDLFLLKTHADGSLQWLRMYGTNDSDEEGHMVQETSDGGYIITGMSDCNYVSDWGKIWLIKTDISGSIIWDKKFEGTGSKTSLGLENYGNSVEQTSDDGYIIAGVMNYEGCLLKTDSNGNEIWRKNPFLNWISYFTYSAKQTTDGGYIATGNGLIKTDSFGNEAWNITIPTTFTAGQQTSDGGYIIAGSSDGYYNGDVWVIKFAPEPETPNLSFTITGGLGINVKITNNGTANATDVVWQIHVKGGIFNLINHTINGTIDISAGETKTVVMGIFFGLGNIQVTVMVNDATKVTEGTQVLIISILKR